MATPEEKIEALTNQLKELQENVKLLSEKRLPAKCPPMFKKSDMNFRNFANNLRCYFQVMKVPDDQQTRLLLTFLDTDCFRAVTRIYPTDKIGTETFDTAVDQIAGILSERMSESVATCKMMRLKQGNTPMGDFITQIERLAEIAFPVQSSNEAKELCMISALISGSRSKILGYEITMFKKRTKEALAWCDIALRAQELDLMLSPEDDEEGHSSNVYRVNSVRGYIKRCYHCGSDNHLIAGCPRRDQHRSLVNSASCLRDSDQPYYNAYEETSDQQDQQGIQAHLEL